MTTRARLQLPGSIQAMNEAPILARTDGYMKTRFVDLGDRVKAGQPLAELDAPEMEEVLRGARATLEQARAALDQAAANLEQGKSDLELAKVSAQRWGDLAKAGIASRQDDDRYRLEYQSRTANVRALEKALNVQKSSVAAAEANVARMENLKSYKVVKAPFDGVITLRNVDAGRLGECRKHAPVPHRANAEAADVRECPADLGQFRPNRPDGNDPGARPSRPRVYRHGGAYRERARPHEPDAAG